MVNYPQAPYYMRGGTGNVHTSSMYYSQAVPQGTAPTYPFSSGRAVSLGALQPAISAGPAPLVGYGSNNMYNNLGYEQTMGYGLGQLPTASLEYQIGAGFGSGGGALGAAALALLVSAFWQGGAQKKLQATQWTLGLIAAASVVGFGFGVQRQSKWEAGVTTAANNGGI